MRQIFVLGLTLLLIPHFLLSCLPFPNPFPPSSSWPVLLLNSEEDPPETWGRLIFLCQQHHPSHQCYHGPAVWGNGPGHNTTVKSALLQLLSQCILITHLGSGAEGVVYQDPFTQGSVRLPEIRYHLSFRGGAANRFSLFEFSCQSCLASVLISDCFHWSSRKWLLIAEVPNKLKFKIKAKIFQLIGPSTYTQLERRIYVISCDVT